MHYAIEELKIILNRKEFLLGKLALNPTPNKAWRKSAARTHRERTDLKRAIQILTCISQKNF